MSSLDLSIPLDVAVAASNPQRFAVRGKYIQIDPGSTGQANLRINSVSDTPRLAYPGQQFSPGDFTDLYFDYIAQPGKFLHVVYGDQPDILSAGQKTAIDPALPNNVFSGSTGAVGNTVITTAAQNPRGAKVLAGVITAEINSAIAAQIIGKLAIFNAAGVYQYTLGSAVALIGAGVDVRSFNLEKVYLRPGENIVLIVGGSGGAIFQEVSYALNLQLL